MPYIPQSRRDRINSGTVMPDNAGELNFAISQLITFYLGTHPLCYQTLADITAALEGAKLEFTRQVVNPYEDRKIAENGGLYSQ